MRILRLVVTTLTLLSAAFAGSNLWTFKSNSDIKWHKLTANGSILAGSDEALFCLDGETGKTLWKRDDLQKSSAYQVSEVDGTPFVFVTKNNGAATKLYTVDMTNGETVWETEKLKGATIGVFPNLDKDMVLILTSRHSSEAKTKPDMIALRLSNGEQLWDADFPDKFDLHQAEQRSRWSVHFDLSGHQPPVFADDAIYFTYAGLHKFDIANGKMLWAAQYDVTEGKLKRGNAQAVIDGDLVYTSSKGQIRAFDKATGTLKWTSPDFGAAVAEMLVKDSVIYGRMGGTFYDDAKRDYELKKPLGVVAVSKAGGKPVWRWDKADDAITNMQLLPQQNTLLIADAKNLIGLDTSGEGAAKENFRLNVEFKRKVGAAETTMKIARFGFGGIQGGLKGLKEDKKREDVPINISLLENGLAVIRGRQHVLAFNPQSKNIAWSTQFEAPGFSGWQKFAMISIAAASYYVNTMGSSSTNYGTRENSYYNANRQKALLDFSKALSQRYSATRNGTGFINMLTTVEDGKEKGSGLVAINMQTGEPAGQVLLNDKEPDYVLDELTGRLFNLKDKEIRAYSIH